MCGLGEATSTNSQVFTIMAALVSGGLGVLLGQLGAVSITKRQIEAAAATAHKQIIAPMRLKWIEELRDLVSRVLSMTQFFVFEQVVEPGLGDSKRGVETYREIHALNQRIGLMINPTEDDHRLLISKLGRLGLTMKSGNEGSERFQDLHTETTELARRVLKVEWERVKKGV